MKSTEPIIRRVMHCGYVPDAQHFDGARWQPPVGDDVQWCPGYTTNLPDVQDAALAFAWSDKRQLDHVLGGEIATPGLVMAISVMAAAVADLEAHKLRESQKERK